MDPLRLVIRCKLLIMQSGETGKTGRTAGSGYTDRTRSGAVDEIGNRNRGGFSSQGADPRGRKIAYLLGCVRRRAPDAYRAAFSARLHELSDAILQKLYDNALQEETRRELAREKRRERGELELHPPFIERQRGASDRENKKRVADRRKTQRDRVYYLLASYSGEWVPLKEILALGAVQYGARIHELRRAGHVIENKIEHDEHGATYSWFRLLPPLKTAIA